MLNTSYYITLADGTSVVTIRADHIELTYTKDMKWRYFVFRSGDDDLVALFPEWVVDSIELDDTMSKICKKFVWTKSSDTQSDSGSI